MLLEVHVVGHGRPAETSGHAPTRPLLQLEKWAGMGRSKIQSRKKRKKNIENEREKKTK